MTSATKEQRRLLYEQLIGQKLADKFTVTGLLGFGGMGAVYGAVQSPMDRKVALKVIPSYDPTAAARFEREAYTVSKLSHPNTVTVFDFGHTHDGQLYLSMEYLEGRTLTDLIRKEGPLHPARVIHIADQICRSLGEAHRAGIMHRDVKPDNILLITVDNDPDFVKVLDFGIAKAIQGEDDVNLTAEGRIVGTPRYMSPEQILALHVDHRSDIYSLGCIMFEMLCGSPPFEQQSTAALMMSHAQQMPPHFSERLHAEHLHLMPPGLEHIVHRTMAKSAEARPRDTDALRDELQDASLQIEHNIPMPMRPPHLTGPHNRPARPTGNHTRNDHPSHHGGPPTGGFEHNTGNFSHQTGNFAHHHGTQEQAAAAHFDRDLHHAQGSSRTPLIVGVILLTIVLLFGIGYVMKPEKPADTLPEVTMRSSNDTAVISAPPTTPSVEIEETLSPQIEIVSSPSGAEIFVEEKMIGTTPHPIKRDELEGAVIYRLKLDGYEDKAVRIGPKLLDNTAVVTLVKKEKPAASSSGKRPIKHTLSKETEQKEPVEATNPSDSTKKNPDVNNEPIKSVTPKVKKLGDDVEDDGPKVIKLN